MIINLNKRKFSFNLERPLKTSKGLITRKEGWLLHLQNSIGEEGWGEVSPIDLDELRQCEFILDKIGAKPLRKMLEKNMDNWPGAIGFGIGSALAEIDGMIGSKSQEGWLNPPISAFLLPTNINSSEIIDLAIKKCHSNLNPMTFKVKVANQGTENEIINLLLKHLPSNSLLRIDPNGGWTRSQAHFWADKLREEMRVEWLEQPLHPNDIEGLYELSEKMPIALDESLLIHKRLRNTWEDWQVRHPALEGDPRQLLNELHQRKSHRVISTSFETGIGKRWINHLAALQQNSCTPTAPGLAPEWFPSGHLFDTNPEIVWSAACEK
tara:strand:+ start:755 stop:1726 length:972 start_codon:yes stop_codon:yes gene_type:complete